MIVLTCEQCGKDYKTKPYMKTKSKLHFCGFKCYGAWQKIHRKGVGSTKVEVTCLNCGAITERQPSSIQDNTFCTHKCFSDYRKKTGSFAGAKSPSWKGGHKYYRGINWDAQRLQALQRDNYTCQDCGATDILHGHHVRPFHLFDTYLEANVLDNIVSLCPSCHTTADAKFWKDHPEEIANRKMPFTTMTKQCPVCHMDFHPRSGKSKYCDACCTHICEICGKQFYSRRSTHRNIRFCSRVCAVSFKQSYYNTRHCSVCGTKIRQANISGKCLSCKCGYAK